MHLQRKGFYTHQIHNGKPLWNENSPSVTFDNQISYLGAKLDSRRSIFRFIIIPRVDALSVEDMKDLRNIRG